MSLNSDSTLWGFGANDAIAMQVDPTHYAGRMNLRPLEHTGSGLIGGHYFTVVTYSNTAAKPAGGSDVVSLRWADSNLKFVLKRLTVAVTTTTTYTATLNQDLTAYMARNFTTAASAGTQILPTAISQKARSSNMSGSLLSGNGALWVSSGDLLTVGTRTLDTQPFGYFAYRNAITTPDVPAFGVMYELRDFGQHPIVLSANEGIVIQTPIGNAQAAGVSKYAFLIEHAEVPCY